jgi:Calx-beta domain-containing protein
VSRTGSTTAPLTVFYAVGGTATAGSDYVELPGRVTIPAGTREGRITVTPVDDAVTEGPETVVVRLAANAAYTLRGETSATVTITGNGRAR